MNPEILKFQNYNTAPENFLLSAIALSEDKDFEHKNPVEIIFIVNGTQLSLVNTINDWYKRFIDNMEEHIEERAKQLVKERTSDKINDLENMLSKLKESTHEILHDAGYKNLDDYSDYWGDYRNGK